MRFRANKKPIVHSLHTNVEAAAKERGRDYIERCVGRHLPPGNITFDQLIERFLASREAKAKHTRENDSSFAITFRSTFQLSLQTPAREIRTGDILAWLNAQAAARRWRNRTFNHYRLWLWQIFALAVADRLILPEENPFQGKMIRRKRPEQVIRYIPTEEQLVAIIENVRGVEGQPIAEFLDFLAKAGVGQAEAKALGLLHIGPNKLQFVRRKTGIPFSVPIYAWLRPVLDKILERVVDADPETLVFKGIGDAGKALRRACKHLGFARFTQRGLRAMLIKKLYDRGVPVKRIALWQGHRDGGKLIQEIYTEVFCDTDEAAEQADLALVESDCKSLATAPRIAA